MIPPKVQVSESVQMSLGEWTRATYGGPNSVVRAFGSKAVIPMGTIHARRRGMNTDLEDFVSDLHKCRQRQTR